MADIDHTDDRKPWTTPELREASATSTENGIGVTSDSGTISASTASLP